MVSHVIPPGDQIRHDAVVFEPDQLPKHVETVQLMEHAQPDELGGRRRVSLTVPVFRVGSGLTLCSSSPGI